MHAADPGRRVRHRLRSEAKDKFKDRSDLRYVGQFMINLDDKTDHNHRSWTGGILGERNVSLLAKQPIPQEIRKMGI
jgi:hypothetical protein